MNTFKSEEADLKLLFDLGDLIGRLIDKPVSKWSRSELVEVLQFYAGQHGHSRPGFLSRSSVQNSFYSLSDNLAQMVLAHKGRGRRSGGYKSNQLEPIWAELLASVVAGIKERIAKEHSVAPESVSDAAAARDLAERLWKNRKARSQALKAFKIKWTPGSKESFVKAIRNKLKGVPRTLMSMEPN